MPTIILETHINAPIKRVFDLARSIDAHTTSAGHTSERAIAGRTTGLIELNDQVTWQAKHFGITQCLTVEITAMEPPFSFSDRMIKGAFAHMDHIHSFIPDKNGVTMMDQFTFRAPLGLLGRCAEALFLTKYMKRFLTIRAQHLRQMAESDQWQQFL